MTPVVPSRRGRVLFFICLLLVQSPLWAQLTPQFTASVVSGCAPIVVQFTDQTTGGPAQWRWELGNGVTSYLQHPSTTYFNPGTYTVKLVVRSASGADSVVKKEYITVYPNPDVAFSVSDSTGCFPLPLQFKDKSTTTSGNITSWKWDLGDGTISTQPHPVHTYTAAGNFTVTLQATNSFGCTKTVSVPQYIKITDGVKAGFTNSTISPCQAPLTVDFTNTSTGPGNLRYTWDFGDGVQSSEADPSHTYTKNGIYSVTLVAVSPQGCRDTIRKEKLVSVGTIQSEFSVSNALCEGLPVTFTNTTMPAPASRVWYFGDGTSSTEAAPVKTYPASGVYTLKLVNTFNGCSDSVIKKVIIQPKIKPAFVASQTSSCQTPFTVSFSDQTTGSHQYQWDFGDGTTATEPNPVHTYTATGNYTVTLIAWNENGCSDTLVKKDYIKIQKPIITFKGLPQTGCTPLSVNPSTTISYHEPIIAYRWDFGDGTISNAVQPSHTYSKAGNYHVILTVTTASGCTETVTLNNAVRAGDKPKADFAVVPPVICAGNANQLTDKSTGNVDQWYWDFGDTYSSTEQNPAHVFDGLGKFTVTLVAWSNTCPDTITKKDVVLVKPPLAMFRFTNSCTEKYTKRFDATSSAGATSWQWDFGDGTTSTEQKPTHTYAKPGTYRVTIKTSNGDCVNSRDSIIKVIDEKAAFEVNASTICKGNSITFSAPNITASNITKWSWNFGDGSTSSKASAVSHVYKKAGKYTVTLQITDLLGCVDTRQQEITVYGITPNFITDVPGACLGAGTITFTDLSKPDGVNGLVKSIWNFGDGKIDSTKAAASPYEHLYSKAGTYHVSLKVVDEYGCSDVITKQSAVVIAQPKALFVSPDTLFCTGKTIRFTNQSMGIDLKYQWSMGDGSTFTTSNPAHKYSQTGLYTIGLTVTDKYGCKDAISKTDYINISLPRAAFSVSDSFGTCPPLLVKFTHTSTNYKSLKWDFGDGNTSTLQAPQHYYTVPGIYYAKLIVTGPGGCTDTALQRIEVKGPKGSFTYQPQVGCKPLTVTFKATTSNRVSFIWDFSDGTTIATKDSSLTHTYTNAGDYVPKMILIDATGCNVPIVGKDTIKVVGIEAGFTVDQQKLCNTGTVRFTNTTVSNDLITKYEWSFGDGRTQLLQNPIHRYSKPGNYTARLIATTQTGCKDTALVPNAVTVFEGPSIALLGDSAACVPAQLTFGAKVISSGGNGLQWAWNFGNGQTGTVQNPSAVLYNSDGTYQVTSVVTDKNGCKDSIAKTVSIHPLPQTHAGQDALVCRDNNIQLNATGAVKYSWKASPDLSCTNCPNPVALPKANATYTVTGYNQFGCSKTDSVLVTVRQRFQLKASKGDTICAGNTVQLWAAGADQYTWYPSTGLDKTTIANPKAKPATTTIYHVVAKDNDNCFADTATVLVKVNPIPVVETEATVTMAAGSSVQLKTKHSEDVKTWRWTPGNYLSCADCAEPKAMPKQTTKYTVLVKNEGGCTSTDDVTVSVICNNGNLFIPNTFSPNGDGMNERFYPRGTGIALIRSLRIFNRWGELVYERRNFQANDAGAGWDGTYKGQKLSPDVYVYSCEVVCTNNEVLPYSGDITLLR